ncbi:PREDICTED: ommochrome-binding protein-like [Papilio xuthus]|uniref:Ommochrome-binding protein-like n=1 Tax=Papilio xuthus TaxID=66420 RepID=A0AAJ6ZT27_PAPXU|nr:PREDICTED: ommochrome-binding protein-like [Papilio xuthus]
MKLVIFLSLFVIIQAAVSKEENCDGITINGIDYERETLKTNLDRPYSLAIDYSTNILYFSYSLKPTDDVFKSVKINLYTKEYSEIEGIENGFVQTVDQINHIPYIGSSKGIFKYDYTENEALPYIAYDCDIWEIYYRDNVLYYSDFPAQFLYTITNGEIVRFEDLDDMKIIHFLIDDNDVMFYTNATGLYSQPKGSKDAYLYIKLDNGDKVRGLTVDKNGYVYACFEDGIYKVNTATGLLEHILEIDDGFGVAFDANNNIVYSDATSVYHLKPNKKCGS